MKDGIEGLKRFFYKHPNSRVHLRKLARRLDVSPGFVSEHITSLVDGGIVKESREGNVRVFTADTSNAEYRRNKRAFNLWEILNSDLVPRLEDHLHPDALILFGSYLKGADGGKSDVDIAVINGRREIPDLSDYEEEFERSIRLTQVDSLEEAEPEFLETLANGFVLSGYLEVGPFARD